MKKRTVFETALVRRVPKLGDFLRYAAYEMSLEALRKKRVERLSVYRPHEILHTFHLMLKHIELPKGPPSVSDYALVRRQFQIFERALKKFKDNVGVWIQYLQVAKREGARALVGRISARCAVYPSFLGVLLISFQRIAVTPELPVALHLGRVTRARAPFSLLC